MSSILDGWPFFAIYSWLRAGTTKLTCTYWWAIYWGSPSYHSLSSDLSSLIGQIHRRKEEKEEVLHSSSLKSEGLTARCWGVGVGLVLCSVFTFHIATTFPRDRSVALVFNWVWFLPFQRPSGVYSLWVIYFRSTELGRGTLRDEVGEKM